MRTRRLLIPAVTAALILGPALPALADHGGPGGWVDVDEDGSEVDVGATDEEDITGAWGGGGPSECTWERLTVEEVNGMWQQMDPADDVTDLPAYEWYWVTCPGDTADGSTELVPVPVADDEPVDPTTLRDEAIDTLTLPLPTIAMNPSGDQVVHLDTWLWIDDTIWQTHSKSVSAGGVTATVTATPQRVTWDLGNGDTLVCDGPGVPYDPSTPSDEQATDCSYAYTQTSAGQPGDAFQVTATVEWTVAWTVTGAAGGGSLPALFTSSPVAVRVAEMQALNQ